ncbi:hypothetical protein [Nocardia terrae]|uniref:hypothetical protein n=1 Tax=Nocardia terrae TaxID=2675851 RepID=UPI0018DFD20A|nr:hypothetical protein [Nocardia terrae]
MGGRRFGVVASALTVWLSSAAPAMADEWWPVGILPGPVSCAALALPGRAGAWPLPMHFPNVGIGLFTMPFAPPEVAARLPQRIDLRTADGGFNEAWQYAVLDHNLYIKAVDGESGWRIPPVPDCLRGRISGISVDRSRLAALGLDGHIYTLESADETPELWWWTGRFGSPVWLDPSGQRVRPESRAWSFSWLDPEYVQLVPFRQQGFWTDTAGHDQPVGGAGVTNVFVLSPEGNRITMLDPWLPGSDPLHPGDPVFADDYSFEMPGPLNGRFRAVNLSSSGSTTFVTNEYGDMYTRLWDFDISGADTIFFSYSYDDQDATETAPNNFEAFVSRYPDIRPFTWQYTHIQLPAPGWERQPKVPGEITSTISIHTTGGRSADRELRVEGRDGDRTGYWHKPIDPAAEWAFTANDRPLTADLLDNRASDSSALTLAPPTGVNFGYRDADGWTLTIRDFDYAADEIPMRVCAADGSCAEVSCYLANLPRTGWQPEGLSEKPRGYHGFVLAGAETWDSVPASLRPIMEQLTGSGRLRNVTLEVTADELVIRGGEGRPLTMSRF